MVETTYRSISIIIPTKNAGPRFARVLHALAAQDEPRPRELIVVDSGSTDGTVALAENAGARLYHLPADKFTHGRARNLGAAAATGDVLVFLVQDAEPAEPGWLRRLTRNLEQPGVAGAYSRQLPRPDASPMVMYFLRTTYPPVPAVRRPLRSGRARLSDVFFSNVGSTMPRVIWERFPFNERMVMSEDQEWARRVLASGYSLIYDAAACLVHSHDYGIRTIFRRSFDSAASLRGVCDDTLGGMAGQGLKYVLEEIRFLIRQRQAHLIPYMLVYEASRSLGTLAGRNHHRLPPGLKRYLGLHSTYWQAVAAAGS
jgi:rhamnosyltransferase